MFSDRLVSRIVKFPVETCAPGKYFRGTGAWKNANTSSYLTNVSAKLGTLTGGHLRLNRSIDQTTDSVIAPGEPFNGTFRIQFAGCVPFQFLVNLYGNVVSSFPYGDSSLDGVFDHSISHERAMSFCPRSRAIAFGGRSRPQLLRRGTRLFLR